MSVGVVSWSEELDGNQHVSTLTRRKSSASSSRHTHAHSEAQKMLKDKRESTRQAYVQRLEI